MTCIRVEVAPKAGPEFPSFSYIAGRHLKEAGLKGRPLQLSFPDSLSGSTVTRCIPIHPPIRDLPREMEAQFDSNRAVKYGVQVSSLDEFSSPFTEDEIPSLYRRLFRFFETNSRRRI